MAGFFSRGPTTTQPGISGGDALRRGRDFFWKPGAGLGQNLARIGRAALIGATTGPVGLVGAAARNAATGEIREAVQGAFRRVPRNTGGGGQQPPSQPGAPLPSWMGYPSQGPAPRPMNNWESGSAPSYSWNTPPPTNNLYGQGQGMMRGPEASRPPPARFGSSAGYSLTGDAARSFAEGLTSRGGGIAIENAADMWGVGGIEAI